MKKKGKVLALMLSAAALVAASVFGTMAYLTDNEAVTNTFTVGRVGLSLDEADVKPDGTYEKDKNTRVQENEYHLLPGYTYIKDPTIHVSKDSEDCYLFVIVNNGIADIEDADNAIAKQMENLDWDKVEGAKDAAGKAIDNLYVLAKGSETPYAVSKGADVVVFNSFTIDGDTVTNENLAECADAKVVVTAYAVQKAGFDGKTPAEIWNATFGK